ncbi:hypothetical protein COCON_G00097250 [Conger conger]|uniref:Fibronectin type-III domain-containing protein n=1 Tax=Conger conger TaxID=82655 RepID=A0A9Q1DMB1_CONCO|nr:hypothetical protein COCON_G00097250 [Conger conger]
MNGHVNEKYSARGTPVPKKTLLTVLCLLTLEATVVTHGSVVAAPQDIWFKSYNLKNVLEWRPGDGAGNKTRYRVQYAIYGDQEKNKERVMWRTKKQCKEVLQTFCDLSNETSDLEEEYYGRVKAVNTAGTSEWTTTSRFIPKRQTTFGPPIVKVTVNERKLIIKLKGPMRWKIGNRSKEYSLAKYYPQMMYNVSIHNSMTKKTIIFLLQNNSIEYGLLDYSTEFCVSAKVLFLSLVLQADGSHKHCITTAKDPFFDQILLVILGYVLPLALTIFFLTLIGCLVYRYIFGNKQKTPSNLWVQHQPDTKLLLTVNHFTISLPKTSCEKEQWEAEGPRKPLFPALKEADETKPPVSRIPGYATQTCAPPLLPQLESVGLDNYNEDDDENNEDDDDENNEDGSEADTWRSQSLDYGIVVKEEEEVEEEGWPEGHGGADAIISSQEEGIGTQPSEQLAWWMSYRRQFQDVRTSGLQEEDEEEEGEDADAGGSILVDWDPNTGRLQIPNLSMLEMEADQEERPECDQVVPTDILANVYVRQSSEDSTASEDALTKIENNWALQINMEK